MKISYEKLKEANSKLTSINVKGKAYMEVNQRIKAFRMLYPNGCITTDIVSIDNGVCIMTATVKDDEGNVLGTGTAYEKEGSTFINQTSYIENCETSAVGRALGMCGIGIETSIASAEEVQNAITNQELNGPAQKDKIETIKKSCKKHKVDSEAWLKQLGKTWETLTEYDATKMIFALKNKYGDE